MPSNQNCSHVTKHTGFHTMVPVSWWYMVSFHKKNFVLRLNYVSYLISNFCHISWRNAYSMDEISLDSHWYLSRLNIALNIQKGNAIKYVLNGAWVWGLPFNFIYNDARISVPKDVGHLLPFNALFKVLDTWQKEQILVIPPKCHIPSNFWSGT